MIIVHAFTVIIVYSCAIEGLLQQFFMDPSLLACAIRLQVDPTLYFRLGAAEVCVGRRLRGVTTGSQSAAILGRFPVEAIARQRMHVWKQKAFNIELEQGPYFANWCHNISTFADTPENAVWILTD